MVRKAAVKERDTREVSKTGLEDLKLPRHRLKRYNLVEPILRLNDLFQCLPLVSSNVNKSNSHGYAAGY